MNTKIMRIHNFYFRFFLIRFLAEFLEVCHYGASCGLVSDFVACLLSCREMQPRVDGD